MYVIGDAHGQLAKVRRLLSSSGLIDSDGNWSAGSATLLFTGDFCDRGPHGIEVVELVMRLQEQAEDVGGSVAALLGNHEVMLLGARKFPEFEASFGSSFYELWEFNGGHDSDLRQLSDGQAEWLAGLRALVVAEEILFMHCDATFYMDFGKTADDVNEAIRAMLHSEDPHAWEEVMSPYFDRGAFIQGHGGVAAAKKVLQTLGGSRIVHGHTPIPYLTSQNPGEVTGPLLYAEGLCLDVDGGMYMGGPGFVVDTTEIPLLESVGIVGRESA
ncbi:MAG TPA: serine/threonine protein phosphatase [Chloroflexi bacterium]|nr:serine/threonine protein phosphatase [Chloroflexota bacterium]